MTRAPGGPIAPDSEAAKGAVKALAGGWSSTLMRTLANHAFTLTELDSLIPEVSYPSLERRLAKMRSTGLVEPVQAGGRGTPYVVTDWLRHSIAPLCAAGRCERRHLEDKSAPITNVEVEASFMLAIPARLPAQKRQRDLHAGGADRSRRADAQRAGQTSGRGHRRGRARQGRLLRGPGRAGTRRPGGSAAPRPGWTSVIDGDLETLRFGGARPQLALDLVNGLHFALFG